MVKHEITIAFYSSMTIDVSGTCTVFSWHHHRIKTIYEEQLTSPVGTPPRRDPSPSGPPPRRDPLPVGTPPRPDPLPVRGKDTVPTAFGRVSTFIMTLRDQRLPCFWHCFSETKTKVAMIRLHSTCSNKYCTTWGVHEYLADLYYAQHALKKHVMQETQWYKIGLDRIREDP